jgi:hypothetical protein
MKTFLSSLLLLLVAYTVAAQNWQPFINGQQNYYKQQTAKGFVVEKFTATEVVTSNSKVFSLQGLFLKSECAEGQIQELYERIHWHKDMMAKSTIFSELRQLDRFEAKGNDFVFYEEQPSEDNFVLKTAVKKGESWISNGFTFVCADVRVDNILGVNDSVKVIEWGTVGAKKEMILSKNHGLIKFSAAPFPFSYSDNLSDYELIGIENSNGSRGYKQPDFIDFFKLNKGDVLFYQSEKYYPEGFMGDTNFAPFYHQDSITSVFTSSDSVHYNMIREVYDDKGNNTDSRTSAIWFTRNREGILINNTTSWFGEANSEFYGELFFKTLQFEIIGTDTISTVSCEFLSAVHDDGCNFIYIADALTSVVQLSTKEGVRFNQQFYDNGSSENWLSSILIGSKINNIEEGITNFKTGIDNAIAAIPVIYPNPANETLFVQMASHAVKSIEVYDLLGNLVTSGRKSNSINIGKLSRGVYLVKVYDTNNSMFQQKILKQ